MADAEELPPELRAAAEAEGCAVSTSTSSSRQWVNGAASWSRSTTYFKLCPGKEPQRIFEAQVSGDGA